MRSSSDIASLVCSFTKLETFELSLNGRTGRITRRRGEGGERGLLTVLMTHLVSLTSFRELPLQSDNVEDGTGLVYIQLILDIIKA